MKKTARDRIADALRIAGLLLLIVGLLEGLSVAVAGAGDSFTPLFSTAALVLAAVAILVWPASVIESGSGTGVVLVAALASPVTLALWIAGASPVAVIAVQVVGIALGIAAALILSRGHRARGALAGAIVLVQVGMVLACGADVWVGGFVARSGALVAAVAAILLGCVLLAAATARSIQASANAPRTIG